MGAAPVGPDARGDLEISGLAADSRAVGAGYLFAALPGSRLDGTRFVSDAARRGAAAVLGPPSARGAALAAGAAFVASGNPRRVYARCAARLHPGQPRRVAAVTGTNGKTSVVWFARQIWQALGHRAASLGTLGLQAQGLDSCAKAKGGLLTTPDAADLHRALAALAADGIDHLAIEASSHGLDQHRIDGVRLSAAVFTSFGRDHLDYHGTEDAYFAAKARLFAELLPPRGLAVLHSGAARLPELLRICREREHRVLTYGRDGDVRLAARRGAALIVDALGESHDFATPLIGGFHEMNLLAAITLAIGSGADPAAAVAAGAAVEAAPGRLQRIATCAGGPAIYVDYAHTPDALRAALAALRPHVRGDLAVVFGCGGDRDAGKRPRMGEIAARYADRVVVTDDNPRTEDPAAIRAAVRAACPAADDIGDRARAIAAALDALGAGDALLIAGKGHETGQIVGDTIRPFDDAKVARALAAESAR